MNIKYLNPFVKDFGRIICKLNIKEHENFHVIDISKKNSRNEFIFLIIPTFLVIKKKL